MYLAQKINTESFDISHNPRGGSQCPVCKRFSTEVHSIVSLGAHLGLSHLGTVLM